MNPWHFILGAYAVTALAFLVESLAVRARHRSARAAAMTAAPQGRLRGASSAD